MFVFLHFALQFRLSRKGCDRRYHIDGGPRRVIITNFFSVCLCVVTRRRDLQVCSRLHLIVHLEINTVIHAFTRGIATEHCVAQRALRYHECRSTFAFFRRSAATSCLLWYPAVIFRSIKRSSRQKLALRPSPGVYDQIWPDLRISGRCTDPRIAFGGDCLPRTDSHISFSSSI